MNSLPRFNAHLAEMDRHPRNAKSPYAGRVTAAIGGDFPSSVAPDHGNNLGAHSPSSGANTASIRADAGRAPARATSLPHRSEPHFSAADFHADGPEERCARCTGPLEATAWHLCADCEREIAEQPDRASYGQVPMLPGTALRSPAWDRERQRDESEES